MSEQEYEKEPLVMALGFFDGVHLGHQNLISQAVTDAKDLGVKSAVLSFENHPLTEIFPRYAPALLMDNVQKTGKIKGLGVDYVFLEPFTDELRKLSPEDFIEKFLLDKYNVKEVVVGFNYSFGYKGQGGPKELKELGERHGFEVKVIEPFILGTMPVSSTRIRELIGLGKVAKIHELLGEPYSVKGVIKEGKKLGRRFGIPTANLSTDPNLLMPKDGVYFTRITIDGKSYDGLTNLGYNPTFPEHPYAIETYIYDFDDDAYGKEATLEFLEYMRGDMKFGSLEELFGQVKSDIEEADRLYRKHGDSKNEESKNE